MRRRDWINLSCFHTINDRSLVILYFDICCYENIKYTISFSNHGLRLEGHLHNLNHGIVNQGFLRFEMPYKERDHIDLADKISKYFSKY